MKALYKGSYHPPDEVSITIYDIIRLLTTKALNMRWYHCRMPILTKAIVEVNTGILLTGQFHTESCKPPCLSSNRQTCVCHYGSIWWSWMWIWYPILYMKPFSRSCTTQKPVDKGDEDFPKIVSPDVLNLGTNIQWEKHQIIEYQ